MANNRFYLVCKRCIMEGKEDHLYFLAKYYPSNGWYTNFPEERKQDFKDELDAFLDKHSHEKSMFGYGDFGEHGSEPFYLHFEAGNRHQDQILIAISEAVRNGSSEDRI